MGARDKNPLGVTILLAVLYFFLIQCSFFSALVFLFNLGLRRLSLFLLVTGIYHGLFFAGLYWVRKEFYFEPSGEPLRRINLPLSLSILRFSSVPTMIFLLLSLDQVPIWRVVVPFLALIFLTDLFDGIAARFLKQTTRIGRMLDSSGDYLIVIVISVLYLRYRLIPYWFVILILIRLIVQLVGIFTLYVRAGYASLKVTFLGKATIFAAMALYGFELLEYLRVPVIGHRFLILVLELIAAGIVLASLAEKIVYLIRSFGTLAKKDQETEDRKQISSRTAGTPRPGAP
jgi:phosphatidylglycerophosphate synthase